MSNIEEEVLKMNQILYHLPLPIPDVPESNSNWQWIINGSGVLAAHGIHRERPMGDLDIFCATAVWFNLMNDPNFNWIVILPDADDTKRRCDPPVLRTELFGLTVDVLHSWRRRGNAQGDFNPAFYICNAEIVRGIPCTPLQFILDWKLGQGRNKDLLDVIAIRSHLGLEVTEE